MKGVKSFYADIQRTAVVHAESERCTGGIFRQPSTRLKQSIHY